MNEHGFPDDTPVAEMNAAQQAAYHKFHSRKWEDRAKARGDYDELKAKADELDKLKAQQMSDAEKAQAEADKVKAELAQVRAQAVDAHITAAVTAGRMTQDQADVLLDGLDRSKYLDDDGRVDTGRVTALLDSIAPAKGTNDGNGRVPDLGQGRRPSTVKPSVQSGRDAYKERHGTST